MRLVLEAFLSVELCLFFLSTKHDIPMASKEDLQVAARLLARSWKEKDWHSCASANC